MMEQSMLKKKEFIDFILGGKTSSTHVEKSSGQKEVAGSDLMDFGFDVPDTEETQNKSETSFAQRLLEASAFGKPDYVQTSDLIRSTDSVARHLPRRAAYWPKTPSRPYQTLLFEAELNHHDLLAIPAFKSRKVRHLDMVEDALARMVSEALDGFQRGGEGVTADVRKGRKEETLCIVSIRDERETKPVRLVSFGTVNAESGGLETFHLTERTRFWDPQLAKEHLGLLYERQFKKLGSAKWQEAFTTTEERKQAKKLLEVCSKPSPQKKEVEENVITLLDTIAKGFGLRCKPGQKRRLQAFELPTGHDIGIDPEEMVQKHGGKNPFGGVTLRDEKSRLLGYIVYPLKNKEDAAQLRSYLERNNRFHNVLVVFPDGQETTLGLWQGTEQLTGKLRKGQGFKDAAQVVSLLSRFFVVSKAKVRNPKELAEELAYRARYLRKLALRELKAEKDDGPLRSLYKNFKQTLIHDQKEGEFADAFAQTLTYSLLTARWIGNDWLAENGERFTRKNAAKYLPATGNFLKKLFKKVLSVNMDEQRGRLLWLVDDIADLLDRVDVTYVFGIGDQNSDQATDPVIHFYEPFLAAYDSELRSKRGVYYTPQPVVSYIVRSVHELLQKEFGLEDGLADSTTWGEMLKKQPDLKLPPLTDEPGEKRTISPSEPFVQILDPATGTATFLVEVIEIIHRTLVQKWQQQGLNESQQSKAWNDYVPKHLLPRIYGFELMMAPYAVAQMKVALKLAELKYKFGTEERANIFLTNALESCTKIQLSIVVSNAIAHEAENVNTIKRYKRFTVVLGNPPYSGHSLNKGEWIGRLTRDYYFVNGAPLGERNPKWLQDDYVKFIRFAQYCLCQSSVGILGYITNHSYLDNPTFRGLRCSLLNSFCFLSCLDLHGNYIRKEKATDGTSDENVFDIQQGVAILLARKSPGSAESNNVAHSHQKGKRADKYKYLNFHSIRSTKFEKLSPTDPFYLFVKQDTRLRSEFESFQILTDVFEINNMGITTGADKKFVSFEHSELSQRLNDPVKIRKFAYRPFDERFLYYDSSYLARARCDFMRNMLEINNIALVTIRRPRNDKIANFFVSNGLTDKCFVSTTDNCQVFPLYSLPSSDYFRESKEKQTNFTLSFIQKLQAVLGKNVQRTSDLPENITPEEVFYYSYGLFHSHCYRDRYVDFLKIDYPRLPLTGNLELFNALANIGGRLVALHLLESHKVKKSLTNFVGGKNKEVTKISWSGGTVWIDKEQLAGFKGVSEDVYNFHIGSHQICNKWLKDRKGRILSDADIAHYQKIIVALSETIRLMAEIDEVIDAHGGWPGAFTTGQGGAP